MRYVLLILLLVSATTANFRGKEYPDSLRLYGSLDNGYVNKHRKVLDVDYWFDGKIVASKFGIRNDDSVMVDWFTIKLGNGKMGHCKVSKHDYSRYDIGDTIGVTKRTIITQAKPKSEQKQSSADLEGDGEGEEGDTGGALVLGILIVLIALLVIILIIGAILE